VQTKTDEETNHEILELAATAKWCGTGGPVRAACGADVPKAAGATLAAAA
jgi:hypothetical protein